MLEIADASLIGGDNGRHIGLGNAIEELLHLLFGQRKLSAQCASSFKMRRCAPIPERLEHGPCGCEEILRGLQASEDLFELCFDRFTSHRLAVPIASALGAEVVRVVRIFAFGPARREWRAAVATHDRTAQGKVGIEILARWRAGTAGETILNSLERLEAD